MKISLIIEQVDEGYNITFKNDPLIEQFFKETCMNESGSFAQYSTYRFIDYKIYDKEGLNHFHHRFNDCRQLYYMNKPVLTFLCVSNSSRNSITVYFKGLYDVTRWHNDFQLSVKEFIDQVIKPYHKTKRFIAFKDNKLVNNNVVNKEGYSKYWFSYYKNYKKSILSFNEALIAK